MKLKGKTVLVTGAASERSIGWGIARELALEGADVAVNDIAPSEALEARAAGLAGMGVRAVAVPADVTQAEQVEAMFARAIEEFGHLDIVVSNAGIIRWQHFMDITESELRAVVSVNVMGTVNVCRAAARHMIARGQGGRIIINSSVQSDVQFPITPVYGATKKAMHTLVGALALELAPHGINVTHIAPGWVRSPLNDRSPETQTPEGVEAQRRVIPLKRDGHLDEMGRAVVYLASSDGDYITGTHLRLDGGLAISKYNL
jgi:glucose 1-dehydrogenase